MTTITKKEEFEKRIAHLQAVKDKARISRYKSAYKKTHSKMYLIMLQSIGVDCDYIAGYDDGEFPRGAN